MGTKRLSTILLVALGILLVTVVIRTVNNTSTEYTSVRLAQQPAASSQVAAAGQAATGPGSSTQPGPVLNTLNGQKTVTEQVDAWNYRCWTPRDGMSTAGLTIATVMGGLASSYTMGIRRNRLNYAARHGYRYCELTSMDQHRIPAFAKLPWILAMLPCTEYVLHVDADAMFYNTSLSLQPWMDYMDRNGVDQLLSGDIITESPINFGIFMVRSRDWIWEFYKRLYNHCACDWGRTHDWPAEQGILYDLLGHSLTSPETRKSRIVHNRGWNHILHPQEHAAPTDVLVHLTYPTIYPDDSPCKTAKQFTQKCKYIGLEYFLTEFVTKANPIEGDPETRFVEGNTTCQKVRSNFLFRGTETYANQGDAKSSSALDFDLDPQTGRILGVKVGEVGCVGWRDKECGLKKLWDTKKGEGPWHMDTTHIGHDKS